MKLRIARLAILKITPFAILLLALAAVPVWALGWPYENGPIDGHIDAWAINFGYIVSDTFVAGGTMSAFSIGVWEFPGDMLTSLDWSITSGENFGTVFGSGTASGRNLTDTFISTNKYGYDIDVINVSASANLATGTTYWLNLQNAAVPSGDPVYWDENSGGWRPWCVSCTVCHGAGCPPTEASESAVGTIASEAFTVEGVCCTLQPDSGAPEPNSILLFGSGVLGVAGLLRRKLNV